MQLSKLEMTIVIGAFLQGYDEEVLNNKEYSQVLEQLEVELEKVVNNSTPNQMKEAAESVVSKFIHGLLEEKQVE